MARLHDHDAGGDPEILAAKAELRDEAWSRLEVDGIVRFPGPRGRIPNFVGAEAAAERLRSTDAWGTATTVKANPDSPQWPVRQRALEDHKTVFMAVPRLAEREPFFLLDPAELADSPRRASSIKGAARSARRVSVAELEPVHLVVTGCVAVDASGARLGKGGGYSDLEFALAAEAGLIDEQTVVATTVHECQVLEAGRIPMTDHDVGLDLIATPERIITCSRRARRPAIRWEELTEEKIASIPLLTALAGDRSAHPAVPEAWVLDRTTQEFTEKTLPRGLLRNHRVAEGVWGQVRVQDGSVEFRFEDEPTPRRLSTGDTQPIPPGRPHRLVTTGPVRLVVEFFVPPADGGR